MKDYLFLGVVSPQRAQLSLDFKYRFIHKLTNNTGTASVSIILNQVVVWIDSDNEWDIFDLRNVVSYILQSNLAIIGYLKGYAYEVEITRVLNLAKGIDYVFGIEMPCIEKRNEKINISEKLGEVQAKINGELGVYLSRCFTDLVSAMKNPEDTGFYCYRAIESLCHHCSYIHNIPVDDKHRSAQWEKFREISGSDETALRTLKEAADPIRHGKPVHISSAGREKLFIITWSVVDHYLTKI